MTRARVPAVLVAGVGLMGVVGGARAEGGDAPGVNDLRLQVERLERAEHAEVTGSEASAMLFDPEHRAAADAVAETRRATHRDVTTGLFLGEGAPSWTPPPTAHLFGERDVPRVAAARDGVDDDGHVPPVLPLAAAALAAGAGASAAVRGRGVRAGG